MTVLCKSNSREIQRN